MPQQKPSTTEVIEVQLPSGELIDLEIPSGSSPEAIREAVNRIKVRFGSGPVSPTPVPQGLKPQPEAQQGPLRRFVGGLGLDAIQGLGNLGLNAAAETKPTNLIEALTMPARFTGKVIGDIGKSMIQSQAEAGQEWLSRGMEGEGVTGRMAGDMGNVSRFIEAAVPIFGPAARSVRKRLESGDVAGAAGEGLGLMGGLAAPELSSLRSVSRVKTAVQELPTRLVKILKPAKSQREAFLKSSPIEIDRIVNSGSKVESVGDLMEIANKHRMETGKEIEQILQANNQPLSSKQLADEMRSSIDAFDEVIDPASVKATRKMAGDFEKKFPNLTLEQAEGFRQRLNAELGLFFRKNKAMQREAMNDPQVAGRLAMREAIETVVESKLQHGSLKSKRAEYSAARKMQDAAHSKLLDEMIREDPSLLNLDSLDTITAGSALAAVVSGEPRLAAGLFKTVLARRIITLAEKNAKKADTRVAAAFRKTRDLGPSSSSRAAQILAPLLIGAEEEPLELKPKKEK